MFTQYGLNDFKKYFRYGVSVACMCLGALNDEPFSGTWGTSMHPWLEIWLEGLSSRGGRHGDSYGTAEDFLPLYRRHSGHHAPALPTAQPDVHRVWLYIYIRRSVSSVIIGTSNQYSDAGFSPPYLSYYTVLLQCINYTGLYILATTNS